MARTIQRRKPVDVEPLFHHYVIQRMAREQAADQEERDKAELMAVLAQSGEKTAEGHRRLMLPSPVLYVTAKGQEKTVVSILRQRRVFQNLNEEATMKLLKRKKLVERCTETVTVLSEDAVLACSYEGLITDDELKDLYTETDQFAFNMEYE